MDVHVVFAAGTLLYLAGTFVALRLREPEKPSPRLVLGEILSTNPLLVFASVFRYVVASLTGRSDSDEPPD